MKRKRAVIITNTVFQIIVAIQMKLTVLKNIDVDLLISDHSVGVEKYVFTGKKTKIFNDIKYIKTREYAIREGNYKRRDELSEFLFSIKRFQKVIKECKSNKIYDYMFSANVDSYTIAMYDTIRLFYNKKVNFYLFEDGLSTYKALEYSIQQQYQDIRESNFAWVYKLTQYGKIFESIKGVFLFNPSLFDWKTQVKKYRIPKINKQSKETIHIMNVFFDYKRSFSEFADKKVIFFEESFYIDNFNVNDVKMVKIISECVGSEHILIKLHPRNGVNRFQEYDIYKNSSIPWEIVYLNSNFDDIELVSISSGSIIHPFVVFGDQKKVIVLQEMANVSVNGTQRIYQKYLHDKIFLLNPEIFYMIKNEGMLKQYFLEVVNSEDSSINSDKTK